MKCSHWFSYDIKPHEYQAKILALQIMLLSEGCVGLWRKYQVVGSPSDKWDPSALWWGLAAVWEECYSGGSDACC